MFSYDAKILLKGLEIEADLEIDPSDRRAAVDRSVTGGAYLEFGKLVKLDVDGVVGVSLALSFRLLGLRKGALVSKSNRARRRRSRTYILNNLA